MTGLAWYFFFAWLFGVALTVPKVDRAFAARSHRRRQFIKGAFWLWPVTGVVLLLLMLTDSKVYKIR